MANANNKTTQTDESVDAFLMAVEPELKRQDSLKIAKIMENAVGEPPKMWGPSIIGFGTRHLVYDTGREMDWMLIGFSPRKANIVLYIMDGYAKYADHLIKLGKHKTGKSCLYINKLDDIDIAVLTDMIESSVKYLKTLN